MPTNSDIAQWGRSFRKAQKIGLGAVFGFFAAPEAVDDEWDCDSYEKHMAFETRQERFV